MVSAGKNQLTLIPVAVWFYFFFPCKQSKCWVKKKQTNQPQMKTLSSWMVACSGLINLEFFRLGNKYDWISGTVHHGFSVCSTKLVLKGWDFQHLWCGQTSTQWSTWPQYCFSFLPLPKYVSILSNSCMCSGMQRVKKAAYMNHFLSHSLVVQEYTYRVSYVWIIFIFFFVFDCRSVFTHLCNDAAICEDSLGSKPVYVGVQLLKLFC